MKSYAPILSGIIATFLITGVISQAYAADMAATLIPQVDKSSAAFTGVKNLTIKYPAGGSVAQQLNGKNDRIEFTVNGTASDPKMADLIQGTDKALAAVNSPVQVTSANLHYTATLKGSTSSAQLLVKVEYQPIMEKFVTSKDTQSGGNIVDLQWRAFKVDGPVKVNSGSKYGEVNINQAIGALQALYPDLASKLASSGAQTVLTESVMDFTRFNTPMGNWHFLFDPVGTYGAGVITGFENAGAKALSVYSLGESSFREGTFEAQESTGTASIDGQTIDIKSQTPPPSGQITIGGYSKLQGSAGQEFAIVTVEAPADAQTSSGAFPIQVLLVFGGMMGAIAFFVLFKARK